MRSSTRSTTRSGRSRRRPSRRRSPSRPKRRSSRVAEVEFREAIRQALDEELARDDVVIFFGDFLPLAMDSLVNQAAKYWYISNERKSVPLTVRSIVGGGGRFGAIHSQTPVAWFQGIPGLKLVAPSTPADAKALLKAAIRDDNPVLFFEHKRLYSMKGEVDGDVATLGEARVVRPGSDITVVSAMRLLHECLSAAETLATEGIDCEVIDIRTLRPLDTATVLRSVEKTNRIVVV